MRTPIYALPGDVFFTRSSSLLGKLIRWAEKDPNEPNGVWANHVGVVVEHGWIVPPEVDDYPRLRLAWVVESLWKTQLWAWWPNHEQEDGNEIRVYRRRVITPTQVDHVVFRAKSFVGRTYGWWKLFAHLFDRIVFRGKKTVSNAMFADQRPICSYTAAKAFAAAGISFGMQPEAADPDEMMDYCEQSSEWNLVGSSRVEVKR